MRELKWGYTRDHRLVCGVQVDLVGFAGRAELIVDGKEVYLDTNCVFDTREEALRSLRDSLVWHRNLQASVLQDLDTKHARVVQQLAEPDCDSGSPVGHLEPAGTVVSGPAFAGVR